MMSRPPDTYSEDVREAFEYCEDCESIVVSVDQHSCASGRNSGHKSAAERARLADLDERPLDEDVLIPQGCSVNNAWAYHELDEAGDPIHQVEHAGGSEIDARAEAIDQGCYPCGRCRVLEERQEVADGST